MKDNIMRETQRYGLVLSQRIAWQCGKIWIVYDREVGKKLESVGLKCQLDVK